MAILYAIIITDALLFWPIITGIVARTFGRKFWVWFTLGLIFPFISMVILHCLPNKNEHKNLYDGAAIDSGTLKTIQNARLKRSA